MKIRFPDALHVRVPGGLSSAIEEAARARCTSHSEWIRQALIQGLRAEGLFPREVDASRGSQRQGALR